MDRANIGLLRNWVCQALIDNDTDMNIEDQAVQLGLAEDGTAWKEKCQTEFDALYNGALAVVNMEGVDEDDQQTLQGMMSVVIGEVFTGPDMWKEALEDGWVYVDDEMEEGWTVEREQKVVELWRQVRDEYNGTVGAMLNELYMRP